MKELFNDAILYFYILSFFTGVTAITLNLILIVKFSDLQDKRLLHFNIAFFLYMAVNFVLFFSRLFSAALVAGPALFSLFDLTYVVFIVLFIRYIGTYIEEKPRRMMVGTMISAGFLYILFWLAVYLKFINVDQNLESFSGKVVATSAEMIIFIASIECTVFYMFRAVKMLSGRKRRNALMLGAFMCLYFIWFFIYNMDVIFKIIGPNHWMLYPFDAIIFLYIAVNVVNAHSCYKALFSQSEPLCTKDDGAAIDAVSTRFQLTAREKEVLYCIDKGDSNQEIAEALIISVHTVKRHVSSILTKTEKKSKHEVVALIRSFENT